MEVGARRREERPPLLATVLADARHVHSVLGMPFYGSSELAAQ
jgi:hypothetical protein